MKNLLGFFLFIQLVANAQPKLKKFTMEGHGQPIVLLNGGTFDMTSLSKHSKLLADSFTVIRMEQYNIQYANEGLTLPKTYSAKTESAGILKTLDSLGINAPIVLVGHSYGGLIAFDFALNHPERVKSLVLVEPPLFDIPKAKGKFTQEMRELEKINKQFTPQAEITEEMVRSFRCALSNCDGFDIRQHPMWPRWIKQKDRMKGLSAVPNYKVDFKKLGSFKKPVLIITSTETVALNKVVDELLSQLFANAKTGSLTGEHIALYQNAETFVQQLKAFLHANPK